MLISTAVCDNGDGMLWSSSDEDGSVRSGCEEDESTDCDDGDSTPTGKGRYNLTCLVLLSVSTQ